MQKYPSFGMAMLAWSFVPTQVYSPFMTCADSAGELVRKPEIVESYSRVISNAMGGATFEVSLEAGPKWFMNGEEIVGAEETFSKVLYENKTETRIEGTSVVNRGVDRERLVEVTISKTGQPAIRERCSVMIGVPTASARCRCCAN